MRADLAQPCQAEVLCLCLVHHHDGAASVGDLRRRTSRDRAVLAERRFESSKRLGGGVGPNTFILRELDRITFALRDFHCHDLIGEHAVLPCRGRLAVRCGRKLILLQSGELVGVVAQFGQRTHRLIGEHVV